MFFILYLIIDRISDIKIIQIKIREILSQIVEGNNMFANLAPEQKEINLDRSPGHGKLKKYKNYFIRNNFLFHFV